jgi:hypothetical protein
VLVLVLVLVGVKRHTVTDGVLDLVVGPGVCDGLAPLEIDAEPVLDGVKVGEAVVVGDGVGCPEFVVVKVTEGVPVIVLLGVFVEVPVRVPEPVVEPLPVGVPVSVAV